MHLKSLTLKGFKSFPGRTRLDFEPGVSVVVGPNGSGKSNITDAVLWAMGEQSPLAVRGQSMQDVIFGGAKGQQARSAAEVELVLDNSDGSLPLDFSEISVLRRLDRAGEGEYRLNGARCRLVDVLEALSDTGLGKEGHSIVSQGRVEAIVTSKPRDRRLLIEEAAGLGKHRKRRRRAQLKLARTQDNLDRALDVEREARSRLRPLKRQAEAAELHERLERQTLEARWELARNAARAAGESLQGAERDAAAARERRAEAEAALEEVARRREGAEQALGQGSERREALAQRCFSVRGAGDRIALRLEAARGAGTHLDERIALARAELAALESLGGKEDVGLDGRLAQLELELERLGPDERLGELERERDRAAEEAERLAGDVAAAEAAVAEAEAAVASARERRTPTQRDLEQARAGAAAIAAELATVSRFLASVTGAGPGAERTLADELSVEPGYELALTAALGRRLRAAVVADLDAGAALLDSAGADGGAALVDGDVAASEPAGEPPTPGAERLLDRVHGDDRALALAARLLAEVWVVEDVATLPAAFAGVAVTRGGRLWVAVTRELSQPPEGGDERLLAERNRRDALVVDAERAAAQEQSALAADEAAAVELSDAAGARETAATALRSARDAHDRALEWRRRAAWRAARWREAPEGPEAERRAQLQARLDGGRRERDERGTAIERTRAQIAADESLSGEAVELVAALERAAQAIGERLAALEEELARDRAAGGELAAELRACAAEEADVQARLRAHGEEVTEVEVRAQQVRDAAAEADAELRELAVALGLEAESAEQPLDDEQRLALEQRIERLARRREQLGPVNPLAKDEYAEAVERVEELESQRTDLEHALRELRTLIAETDREIRETFEQTFAATAHNFEEVIERLFPGGRGRLTLVRDDTRPRRVLGGEAPDEPEPEAAGDESAVDAAAEAEEALAVDPDEDLGVEIEVTPAGKSMKRLSLLSGGEKSLTALAFLFAVFLARPCPFYILDEVEAALDDVNIDRFLDLLRRYSRRAQFIVVTHQKRTMGAADVLYGVSMGADGISKVVSRRLPAAVEAEDAGDQEASAA